MSVDSLTPLRIGTITLGSGRSLYLAAGMGYRWTGCWARATLIGAPASIKTNMSFSALMEPPRKADRRAGGRRATNSADRRIDGPAARLICPHRLVPPV